MSSNEIAFTRMSSRPSRLSRARGWAQGAILSALLGAAAVLGISFVPALAAPTNVAGGLTVTSALVSPDNGTGGPGIH